MVVEREKRLKQIFESFDRDKDGVLDRYELKKGFIDNGFEISDQDINKMFEIADANNNHTIEWEEFYHILQETESQTISDIADYWLQYSSKPLVHSPTVRKETPSWKLLTAGGVAGAVSRTCTSPLERLKILQQIGSMNIEKNTPKYQGVIPSLKLMYKTEGFLGFFKGNGTNVIRIAPYSAIQFLSYEKYKNYFLATNSTNYLTTTQNLFVGGSAGVTSLLFTYPLDLIRARLTAQVHEQRYSGISDAFSKIVKEEGYLGLYKGLFTSAVGVAPYVAINFTTYESLKFFFMKDHSSQPSIPASLLFGAVSGATAQTLTYPIDLLRRRLQLQGIGGAPLLYKGPIDATKKIIKEEGIAGLYKGMVPCYLKVVPAISISFCVYELMKKVLNIETTKISYSSS